MNTKIILTKEEAEKLLKPIIPLACKATAANGIRILENIRLTAEGDYVYAVGTNRYVCGVQRARLSVPVDGIVTETIHVDRAKEALRSYTIMKRQGQHQQTLTGLNDDPDLYDRFPAIIQLINDDVKEVESCLPKIIGNFDIKQLKLFEQAIEINGGIHKTTFYSRQSTQGKPSGNPLVIMCGNDFQGLVMPFRRPESQEVKHSNAWLDKAGR